jgi:hypothetical protein
VRHTTSLLALVPLLSAALCGPPPDVPPQNEEPIARIVWPQIWPVDDPVPFDATASDDPEGALDAFRMTFGDGTEQQEKSTGYFEHLYAEAGSYDFLLRVRDDGGRIAEIVGNVVVVTRTDDPICSCDLPCFEPATCTSEGCFLAATTESDGGVPASPGTPVTCD